MQEEYIEFQSNIEELLKMKKLAAKCMEQNKKKYGQ